MADDATGLMEVRLHEAGYTHVAGADEVGRGSLAGPLYAAAVILPPDIEIQGLRDSKMCTKKQRERLAEEIKDAAVAYSIVKVTHSAIDQKGLNPSNMKALRRAVTSLDVSPEYVLIDCFRLKRMPCPTLGVKKADAVSKSVAAASIIAKVERDAAMRRYHRRYPKYGFATNAGYGTRAHWNALIEHGPSPVHRLSFFGVTGFPDENGVVRPHKARDLSPEERQQSDLQASAYMEESE